MDYNLFLTKIVKLNKTILVRTKKKEMTRVTVWEARTVGHSFLV